MSRTRLLLAACLGLIGCAEPQTARLGVETASLGEMRVFAGRVAPAPALSNAEIAHDILDLVFELENGTAVPVLTRFEGPITVAVRGRAPGYMSRDLDLLLARLRAEAGLDIARTSEAQGTITIETVARAQIKRVSPSAACIVRPNVSSWREFRARRGDPDTGWENLRRRERMAVFLPLDVSPQEMRSCLHEEIAQALGPVNDLHRLTQSVFNDDDFHVTLTGFDMIVLRAIYDPALTPGMTRAQVAARLPAILDRINPAGRRAGRFVPPADRPDWTAAMREATDPSLPRTRRVEAARRSVRLAQRMGRLDPRRAYAHYVLGRLSLPQDPDTALTAFLEASRIYSSRPDAQIQEAHVAMQIAAWQLATGRPEIALSLVDQHLPAAERAEHAALMSLMLMLRAEAYDALGRSDAASLARREATAWGRYGFGSDAEIARRLDEVAAIAPGPASAL